MQHTVGQLSALDPPEHRRVEATEKPAIKPVQLELALETVPCCLEGCLDVVLREKTWCQAPQQRPVDAEEVRRPKKKEPARRHGIGVCTYGGGHVTEMLD